MRIVYPTRIAIAVALASTSFLAGAQEPRPLHEEERIEEIIITGAFAGTRAETMLPITVLSGEELREKSPTHSEIHSRMNLVSITRLLASVSGSQYCGDKPAIG